MISATRKITMAALFAALSIVLTRYFSILIPLQGVPSLSLELGGVPVMISGILLGPVTGGVVGLASDLLGFLINSRGGPYHPGFTLNAILTGMLPGILFWWYRRNNPKRALLLPLTLGMLGVLGAVSLLYLLVAPLEFQEPWIQWVLIGAVVAIEAIGIFVLLRVVNKENSRQAQELPLRLLLVVMSVEILVYISLTPLWIYGLYGIPSIFSLLSRVFRAVLMIPLKTVLLLALLRVLPRALLRP